MSLNHGAYQEGKAAGFLIGEAARNPYTEAARRDDWSALVECERDWESGKVVGIAMRPVEPSR